MESGNQSDPNMARLKTLYEKMTCEFLNVKSALLGNNILMIICIMNELSIEINGHCFFSHLTLNPNNFRSMKDTSSVKAYMNSLGQYNF